MAEQAPEDFSKLPLEEKLSHKVWRARLLGYEEAAKLFRRIDDEKSLEYNKYSGLIKKFVVDSNQVAQEKGLEAALAFVECAHAATRICSEVVSGIVSKCLQARPKSKELAVSVCLMFVEVEQFATVQEEVMTGFSNKLPKIVAGSVQVITRMLQEFGAKVLNVKSLMKVLPTLFIHGDKNVRAEAKTLSVELVRWVGAAVKPPLEKNLKPLQLKELEEEWAKLPGNQATPTRFIRSEQGAPEVVATPTSGDGGEGGGAAVAAPVPTIDPYDLFDPVNLLAQMPKDFFERIVDTKWKERKEVLEVLLPLAQSPKLEPGEYGELVKSLKKVISKDSNVMVVALAGNVVTGMAKGLRKSFQTYAAVIMAGILEKFKEKKLNVVNSLRDAADAVFLTTTIGGLQDEVLEALANKNPSVKAETLLFLCRCFQQATPTMLPKPMVKAFCPIIVQKLEDTTPQVREAGSEALGTMLRVLGDRPMSAFLEGVDKAKMAKIQEHRETVELKIQTGIIPSPMKGQAASSSSSGGGGVATPTPAAADKGEEPPVKRKPALSSQKKNPPPSAAASDGGEGGEDAPVKKKPATGKPKRRLAAAAADKKPDSSSTAPEAKKPPAASGGGGGAKKKAPPPSGGGGGGGGKAAGGKGKGKGGAASSLDPPDQPEPAIAAEEVEEKAAAVLDKTLLGQLLDTKWKDRLEAHEKFKEFLDGLPSDELQSHLFCKVLARKPGWKDSNFQVMNAKFAVVATLAERAAIFGKRSTACALPGLVDKFADIKVKTKSGETLMLMAERMGLNYIGLQVLKHAFEQKSPKVQSESLEWMGAGLKAFGFLINIKPFIEHIKKGLAATNPQVRTAAIALLSVLHLYLGAPLRVFFEDEKPALLQQIDAAFEKMAGETAPPPTRGPNVAGDDEEEEGEGGEGGGAAAAAPVSLADLMPKQDISGQIKSELIKELGDKNWKIRGEALQKVQEMISAAKFIQPSLGDLPGALKARLADSNKNLIITTLNIISSLAGAMGSGCSKFARVFVAGTISTLSDSKPHVRAAAVAALNTWHTELTLVPFAELELLSSALETENPNLRSELLSWLEEKLPGSPKLPPEFTQVVPPLYACLEDRSGEVRKKAQALLPLVMAKVGYDVMLKHTGKLEPASKQVVKPLLEKHKASIAPSTSKTKQPPPSSSAAAAPKEDSPPPPPPPSSAGKGGGAKAGGEKSVGKAAAVGGDRRKKVGADGESKGSDRKKPAVKGSKDKAQKSSSSAGEEGSGAPLVFVPRGKEQRMKEEEKMKSLKWNFASPRAEHIEQLKEQMQPCVSASLFTQLFHADFKQHLAALAIMTKCVSGEDPQCQEAAVGCLDLLLRWVTLRFFETNTSVNLKSLDFLHTLFQMLVCDGRFRMSDYEANAFLPYLVQKVGDAKEPVRKGVHALFRELCSFFPPAKLFGFLLDGLKSKNARQRTECLEELAILVQNNGMAVCGSQPSKTVPLIAGLIAERDNAVRSAALNTVVVMYANIGDGVFKYTSQLSEKDVSLLEERIRRSGKKPPTSSLPAQPSSAPPPSSSSSSSTAAAAAEGKEAKQKAAAPSTGKQPPPDGDKAKSSDPPPSSSHPSHAPPQAAAVTTKPSQPHPSTTRPSGPFKFDAKKYLPANFPEPFDFEAHRLSSDQLALLHAPVPEKKTFPISSMPRPGSMSLTPSRQATTSAAVDFIISQINSSDSNTTIRSIKQIEVLVQDSSQRLSVSPHVDQLLRALLLQLRLTFATPLSNASTPEARSVVMEMARPLTGCLATVLSEPSLAKLAGQDSLVEVEREVLTSMVDDRLTKLEDAAQLIRSFNYLMLRLCENCNKTAVFGSLLQVLLQSINSDGSSTQLTELTMKCLWKVTRQLPQLLTELSLDELLREVHVFIHGYVKLVPSPTPEDTPYRTVKTILYHLMNLVGVKVMDHLTLIKDRKHSRVTQYLRKMLAKKGVSVDGDASEGTPREKTSSTAKVGDLSSIKLPPDDVATLKKIFQKISSTATTKEGLQELYHYLQEHPSVDLATDVLQPLNMTRYFESYIARGVKRVEIELAPEKGGSLPPTELELADRRLQELKNKAVQIGLLKPGDVKVKNSAQEESAEHSKPPPSASIPKATSLPQPTELSAPKLTAPETTGGGGGIETKLEDFRRRLDKLR